MSSVFNNKLKKFKSDITGEEKDYVVNNYLWIILDDQFSLSQTEFDKQIASGETLVLTKFVTAVLIANGVETTYEEVAKNTDAETINEFYNGFFETAFPQAKKYLEMIQKEKEKSQKVK